MTRYANVAIYLDPAMFQGRPTINGHRITVHDVAVLNKSGKRVEEIAEGYGLTPEEVEAALLYYRNHREQVDHELEDDRLEIARRASKDSSEEARRVRTALRDRTLRS